MTPEIPSPLSSPKMNVNKLAPAEKLALLPQRFAREIAWKQSSLIPRPRPVSIACSTANNGKLGGNEA